MGLIGREVEINKPESVAHGMRGQITEKLGGGYLAVSLHGESERHEGSEFSFEPKELLFVVVEEKETDDDDFSRIAVPTFTFVLGLIAGGAWERFF